MNENKTGKLFQQLRKQEGYTQSDLAEVLGVTFQAVSKWERGENLPDSLILVELSTMYKVTVDELLRGELLFKEEDVKVSYTIRNVLIVVSVLLYMSAGLPFIILENSSLALILTLSFVIIATGTLTYVGLKYSRTFARKGSQKSEEEQRLENIVYSICFVIFMVTGLLWGLFQISWMVFILGYVVILIISGKKE